MQESHPSLSVTATGHEDPQSSLSALYSGKFFSMYWIPTDLRDAFVHRLKDHVCLRFFVAAFLHDAAVLASISGARPFLESQAIAAKLRRSRAPSSRSLAERAGSGGTGKERR